MEAENAKPDAPEVVPVPKMPNKVDVETLGILVSLCVAFALGACLVMVTKDPINKCPRLAVDFSRVQHATTAPDKLAAVRETLEEVADEYAVMMRYIQKEPAIDEGVVGSIRVAMFATFQAGDMCSRRKRISDKAYNTEL